jgi:hypothetical protein
MRAAWKFRFYVPKSHVDTWLAETLLLFSGSLPLHTRTQAVWTLEVSECVLVDEFRETQSKRTEHLGPHLISRYGSVNDLLAAGRSFNRVRATCVMHFHAD